MPSVLRMPGVFPCFVVRSCAAFSLGLEYQFEVAGDIDY